MGSERENRLAREKHCRRERIGRNFKGCSTILKIHLAYAAFLLCVICGRTKKKIRKKCMSYSSRAGRRWRARGVNREAHKFQRFCCWIKSGPDVGNSFLSLLPLPPSTPIVSSSSIPPPPPPLPVRRTKFASPSLPFYNRPFSNLIILIRSQKSLRGGSRHPRACATTIRPEIISSRLRRGKSVKIIGIPSRKRDVPKPK